MSAVVEQEILVDEWRGLYRESWKGIIVDEAFAHPAKFSRALIQRIYEHVIDEGWASKGDSVIDPFGGVALGAFPAMQHGLNWLGCELEEKFVALGNQNIALWNERYSRMPNWGNAKLFQGDSRKLLEVLSVAECCVSSPPYAGNEKSDYLMSDDGKTRRRDEKRGFRQGHGCFRGSEGAYGQSEGQLGAMKEGDHSIAITSPPYIDSLSTVKRDVDDKIEDAKMKGATARRATWGANKGSAGWSGDEYGTTDGQLGAMPEGELCVTSPPYNPPMSQDHNGTRGGQRGTTPSEKGAFVKYGNSEGQLEGMSMNGFSAAISSPPYEGSVSNPLDDATRNLRKAEESGHTFESMGQPGGQLRYPFKYSGDVDNLGNQRGETFWSASRLILEQLYQVLQPGGVPVDDPPDMEFCKCQ